ncbi:MAG TPA: serine hydrolase domain-containing protein [Gemmatimonadaceae bacterium]|nr:serine hydrolase domain-containing protein [Gemmatimonadaceae bacterium]
MAKVEDTSRVMAAPRRTRSWVIGSVAALAMVAASARAQTATPHLADDAPSSAVRDSMRAVLERGLADKAYPGAIAVVGDRHEAIATVAVGHQDWAASPKVDEYTIWDLASLTKVIGTTTALMQLWADHRVDLDAPVQRYLPEFVGPHKELVTVRHLLTHSSGLPGWRPLYKEATSPAEALRLLYQTPLDTLPGVRMVYSDLGAMLLGKIVERVSGEPLDVYLRRHVFAPLGMTSTMFKPPKRLLPRIAPTERDPWRGRLVHGEVHDENAYFLGGVSGHAGLFSDAADLSRFARMYLEGGQLDGARIVTPAAIDTFTRVQDSALSNRALGWEVPNGSNSAGHEMSNRAFGHTGFTGTSIWIDPARDLFVILLTNRVDPTRDNPRLGPVRVQLADAVVSVIDAHGPTPPSAAGTGAAP